jgi:hypothetical protein
MLSAALTLLCAQAGATDEVTVDDGQSSGYSADSVNQAETLKAAGYVDVGFARAGGNGSSFVSGDTRVPADYFVDAFSPAINSRGEVASIEAGGRFTNGFLPRSVGIGSRASFLLNTASLELRYAPKTFPLFLFVRTQLMPRFLSTGGATRLELQQAFGKLSPFKDHDFSLSAGRFDSVFGIEYLDVRMGITPSLIARYTTGHSIGVKAFYRLTAASLKSAWSLNVAATNHGTRIEALVPPDISLTGVPVGSGRLGYEFSGEGLQFKLGVSGLYGPRNDQMSPGASQWAIAGDVRATFFGVTLSGELLRLGESRGSPLKMTNQGTAELASAFNVLGGWLRLSYTLPFSNETLSQLSVYGRYDRREAAFEGVSTVKTSRWTAGLKAVFSEMVALKAEVLFNREHAGATEVDNDVFTSSVVFSF